MPAGGQLSRESSGAKAGSLEHDPSLLFLCEALLVSALRRPQGDGYRSTAAVPRRYFGQAAFSFAAIEAYSSGESFLLGAGVPGGPSPK